MEERARKLAEDMRFPPDRFADAFSKPQRPADLPPPPAAASNFAPALPMEAGGSNPALDGGGGSATITTGLE